MIETCEPKKIHHDLFLPDDLIPNNKRFPLIIYEQAFESISVPPAQIQIFLKHHHWVNSWVDTIYDYHHYHSNNHETLVIINGKCKVQMGGPHGKIYEVISGDVIIIPAGVAHKSLDSSEDFECIGCYPWDTPVDIKYGKTEEHPEVDQTIVLTGLPKNDPIYGENGPLFNYWK